QGVAVQGTGNHVAEVRVVQLDGRQVDRHAQVRQALVLPFAQLPASLVQNPFTYRDDGAALLGQGNEQVRRHHAALGVVPAQQRLDAGHPLVAQTDLRLVHQVELIVCQGFAQTGGQFAAHAHLGIHAGDVELEAVT